MPEFRFEGTAANGKSVQGVITIDSLKIAKKKIGAMASSRHIRINKILQKRNFLYRIQKGSEKPITGEQKAFTKEEVSAALQRLGYKVLRIQPKLLDFRSKPPQIAIVSFVRVSANLLTEKLPFNEVLQLLVNDIENKALKDSIKEIINDLHHGKDSEEAFMRQEKYLGRFTARMLGLASKSGNMADIYESTATFLERNTEFKKSIKSALIMPLFTLALLMGVVVFYIAYIFPETAKLFVKLGTELPPMTKGTLVMSDFLIANMNSILIVSVLLAAGAIYSLRLPKVQFYRDKFLIRMPVMGTLIHKTTIEIFCRVFYALYSGAGENIDAIRLSAEASGNKYFEHRIKTVSIPMMLSKGTGLVEAFEASGVFTKTALSRFNAGAETGTLKKAALQIANYYEKETVFKLKNIVEFIQLIVAMLIMLVLTALTVVSSETATIKPKTI
ncbi:MAG: type II secretion system F family protein [FCB group bacterium]|nr:type II secretion system F family protein [FCB group bacterium]